MQITSSMEIYDIFAKYIYDVFTYGEDKFIREYKCYTKKNMYRTDYYEKIEACLINGSLDYDKFNSLLEIADKQPLINRIIFLIALDILNIGSKYIEFIIKDSRREKILNFEYRDKIKIFPSYGCYIDHSHTINNDIASLFNNLCFYIEDKEISISNYYIENLFPDNGYIKIGFIPYSCNFIRDYDEKEIEELKYLIPRELKNISKEDDEHLKSEVEYLAENDVKIIIMPETITELDFKFAKSIIEKYNCLIIGPASYDFQDENNPISYAKIYNSDLIPDGYKTIQKVYPYLSKYKNDSSSMEKIYCGNEFCVLHIKGFGRILVLICSDAFHPKIMTIIRNLNIDCIIVLSATVSYNAFNNKFSEEINSFNRIFLQCNLCSECFEKSVIPQVNYQVKGANKDIDKCNKKCNSVCNKHFVISLDINETEKIKIVE